MPNEVQIAQCTQFTAGLRERLPGNPTPGANPMDPHGVSFS